MDEIVIISGKRRNYSRERAHMTAKRHGRRRALHELLGTTCSCGAPATCLVDPHYKPSPTRSDLHRGPADRGLSSRAKLIMRSVVGRVPMCRLCQVSSQPRGASSRFSRGLEVVQTGQSPALVKGEATTVSPKRRSA